MIEEMTPLFTAVVNGDLVVDNTTEEKEDQEETNADATITTPLLRMTVLVWVSMASLGMFALFQYVLPAAMASTTSYQERWEKTDPGLYRDDNGSTANTLMIVHLVCGIYLMFVGPIQLLPRMRKPDTIMYHRWIGRIYLLTALIASSCITMFILLFRTSRLWIHEDVGNVLFGLAVFLSTIQSYRYIAIPSQKNIQLHKLWSWRLFGIIFGGAPLYRICTWPIYILGSVVLPPIDNGMNPPHPIISVTFYCIFIPWIVIELIYRNQWKLPTTNDDGRRMLLLNWSFGILLALLLPILVLTWIPAMFDLPTTGATTEMKIND